MNDRSPPVQKDGKFEIARAILSETIRPNVKEVDVCFTDFNASHLDLLEEDSWKNARHGLFSLVDRSLPTSVDSFGIKNQLEKLAFIHFCFGREMVPLYIAYADTLINMVQRRTLLVNGKEIKPLIIFEGRDSLPFLKTFSARHGFKKDNDWLYSPSSRGALGFTTSKTNDEHSEKELKDLIRFYRQHDLFNRPLIFADFGFNGTLPRIQRLMLEDAGYEFKYGMDVLLAFQEGARSAADLLSENGFLSSRRNARREKRDSDLKKNVYGLMNFLDANSEFEKVQLLQADNRFLTSLQEMGSYIKQFRPNGFGQIDKPAHSLFLQYMN